MFTRLSLIILGDKGMEASDSIQLKLAQQSDVGRAN